MDKRIHNSGKKRNEELRVKEEIQETNRPKKFPSSLVATW